MQPSVCVICSEDRDRRSCKKPIHRLLAGGADVAEGRKVLKSPFSRIQRARPNSPRSHIRTLEDIFVRRGGHPTDASGCTLMALTDGAPALREIASGTADREMALP